MKEKTTISVNAAIRYARSLAALHGMTPDRGLRIRFYVYADNVFPGSFSITTSFRANGKIMSRQVALRYDDRRGAKHEIQRAICEMAETPAVMLRDKIDERIPAGTPTRVHVFYNVDRRLYECMIEKRANPPTLAAVLSPDTIFGGNLEAVLEYTADHVARVHDMINGREDFVNVLLSGVR